MNELTTHLTPLLQKEPIISTFDSRTIIYQPEEVITNYVQHAATYVVLDHLRDLEHRFIEKIIKSQTPKACLVARYGYGKTTAAIGLWDSCRRAQILAIPPAGYTSMAEIAATVYSWTRTVLHGNEGALTKLDELHATYLQSSTEGLAKLVSRRSGRSYEEVFEVLTDPALQGSLRLDPPTTNIVLFLEALTHIVVDNGYRGVAVFVDEFQQLLGKAGADILTSLRSLVWGLRTRKIQFGLAITMDPNSERILGERAGDILHRIKDDDLYLDFRQIHNSEFPKLLWERFAKQLELDELTYRIVDKPALESLGQICERADLSNGPRTVANAFRRIAAFYAEKGRTYTPLQLIDDFLTGAIIFDGDANTIASLVTEFAGYAYFQRTDSHLAVLKLLAAFPSGCPIEVAERYGLLDTFKQITSDLRGDIVTLLPNGYALIDLQRVGKPLNKLSIILKKYWMQITNSKEEPSENIRRFATYVLPLLFPLGTNQTESWNPETALALSIEGSYIQVFAGRLHARHPLRRIRVLVCTEEASTYKENVNTDINLVFVLYNNSIGEQKAMRRQDNSLIFHLNIGRTPKDGLPADLRIVEHNLSPQPSTPAALLNVIEFVEREISITALKQSEQAQVSYTLENIRRWLLNFIFDEYLLGPLDQEAATPGYRGIRDLLFRECERRFPQYNTLITSHMWRDNLAIYRKALAERPLVERRGIEPLKGSKADISALFGQRSHAGFDSKMRFQYPSLLNITWTGEQGSVQFISHPIETRVLTFLGEDGREYNDVVEICRAEGYAQEETEEIFALLMCRGQIKEETGRIHKVDTVSAAELKRLGTDLVIELQSLKEVLPTGEVTEELDKARSLTVIDTEDTDRQRAHAQLVALTERMTTLRAHTRLTVLDLFERQRSEIGALLRSLDKPIPGFSAEVSFKNHLEGARKHLEESAATIQRGGIRLRESIQGIRNRMTGLQDTEVGAFLLNEVVGLRQRAEALHELQRRTKFHLQKVEQLSQWVVWGEHFLRLRHNIATLASQLNNTSPSIEQLANLLAEIESEVRELLSHQGLTALEQIDKARERLNDVAKEYDRSLAERERAFEQEKSELEAIIVVITDDTRLLRSKYQISKHEESYQDLYLEVFQIIQEAVSSLLDRAQLLDAQIHHSRKTKLRGHVDSIDPKAMKMLVSKVEVGRKRLMEGLRDVVVKEHTLLEELSENLLKLKKQLNEAKTQFPIQTLTSMGTIVLLSKLSSSAQDLSSLVDIKEALAALPSESELAALLQLYLNGDIIVEVRHESNLAQIGDEEKLKDR